MDSTWAAVEAVSTAFAAIVVLTGLLYAKSQIGEAQRTRNASLLLELRDKFNSPEVRVFRRRLLAGEFGPSSRFHPNQLSESDRRYFWRMVDELETLVIFADTGLLDLDLVVAAFRSTPPRIWRYIRPWILEDREQRVTAGYSIRIDQLMALYEQNYRERFGAPHDAYDQGMKLAAQADNSSQPEDATP